MKTRGHVIYAVAVALGAVLLLAGCTESEPTASEGGKPPTAVAAKPPDAPAGPTVVEAGNQATCPVMGGKITKAVYTDYEGMRVYFCCPGCDGPFKQNPEKYIRKLQDAGVTLAKLSTREGN